MEKAIVKQNSLGVNEYLLEALITLGINKILAQNASKIENNIPPEYYYQLLLQNQLHTEKFTSIDKRFDGVDTRLDGVDKRLDNLDAKIDKVDAKIDKVEAKFDKKFDALSSIVMRNSEDIRVLQSQMKLYFKILFALLGASFVASSLIDLFFG